MAQSMDTQALAMEIMRALHARVEHLETLSVGADVMPPFRSVPIKPYRHPNYDKQVQQIPIMPPKDTKRWARDSSQHKKLSQDNSEEGLKLYNIWFNAYWRLALKAEINFLIIAECRASLSMTEPSMLRNLFIKQFFPKPPVCIDVFAGIGGDLITFAYIFGALLLIAIQNSLEAGFHQALSRPFMTLQRNVSNFLDAYPNINRDSIQLVSDPIQVYLRNSNLTSVDFMFVDPPWIINNTNHMECTPEELWAFLKQTVFDITGQWFKAHVICIKTRFDWTQCAGLQALLPDYIRMEDLSQQPFSQIYHSHVFLHNQAVNFDWEKSMYWYNTYEDGKPRKNWEKIHTGLPKNRVQTIEDQTQPIFTQGKASDYPASSSDPIKQLPRASAIPDSEYRASMKRE